MVSRLALAVAGIAMLAAGYGMIDSRWLVPVGLLIVTLTPLSYMTQPKEQVR